MKIKNIVEEDDKEFFAFYIELLFLGWVIDRNGDTCIDFYYTTKKFNYYEIYKHYISAVFLDNYRHLEESIMQILFCIVEI